MSALSVHAPRGRAAPVRPSGLTAIAQPDGSVQWLMKRNCSLSPLQLGLVFASLCLLALAFGAFFWTRGAVLVLPFAGVEVAALGTALLVYARHAADRETMVLRPGRLSVECILGRRREEADFPAGWVRVEPRTGDGSLIELSGQGRRIAVGRFVRPELRPALADELRAALRRSSAAR